MLLPHRPRLRPGTRRGVTLIELMVVVAVIAILASIGYPSYLDSVAKGRRAEARSTMLEAQQWMERFYSENFRYDQNTAGAAVGSLFAARFSQVPASGAASYTLSLADLGRNSFTIVATRAGAMANDKCGNLALTHTGARGARSHGFASEAEAVRTCWR